MTEMDLKRMERSGPKWTKWTHQTDGLKWAKWTEWTKWIEWTKVVVDRNRQKWTKGTEID